MFAENYYMQPYNFYMNVICNKTATGKVLKNWKSFEILEKLLEKF